MGLFSKVKNVAKKAANVAFNPSSWVSTAKDIAGSSWGQMGMEALGTYMGYPGLGSAIGGMLGGGNNPNTNQPYGWGDIFNAGLSGWSAQDQAKKVRETQEQDYQRAYQDQMQLAQMQNASAKDLASWETIWGRENAQTAQDWTRSNMALSQEYNQTNAREQMAFQERMASTQHQRETSDLRAAGLNPVLSGTGGMGSAAPAGAAGSVGTPSGPMASQGRMQPANLMSVVTSAFGAMQAMANATQTTAQTNYLQGAQTALTKSQTTSEASKQSLMKIQGRLNQDQSLKIATEIKNLQALRDNIPKTGNLTTAQTAQVKQTTNNLKQIFRKLNVEADLSEQDQAFWNNLLNQSGSSAHGVLQLLNSLRALIK